MTIRPEDADMEQVFTRQLSDEAKYFRFMNMEGEVLSNNFKMLDLMKSLNFPIATSTETTALNRWMTSRTGKEGQGHWSIYSALMALKNPISR